MEMKVEKRSETKRVIIRMVEPKNVELWDNTVGHEFIEKVREIEKLPTLISDLEVLEIFCKHIRICFRELPNTFKVECVITDGEFCGKTLEHFEYRDINGVISNLTNIETDGWKYLGWTLKRKV